MNGPEVVKLCAVIAALCPAQKFTEFTPDAWELVLEDIPFPEAQEAVRTIYREQGSDAEWVRRIEADDIIRQVRRVRRARLERVTDVVPPAGMSQPEERAWLRGFYSRAAAGLPVDANTRGELKPRPDLPKILEAARPRPSREAPVTAHHAITQAEIDAANTQLARAIGSSVEQ